LQSAEACPKHDAAFGGWREIVGPFSFPEAAMSQISSLYGGLPGMGAVQETYEAAFTWGPWWRMIFTNGWIDANAVDVGNTPTYRLRPGLVLGQITASGRWTNYVATNTDGSQIARGVLWTGLRMQDVYTGLNTQKFQPILVAGGLQTAKLLGLDLNAQQNLNQWFQFDQNLTGSWPAEFQTEVAKTASYSILASDNYTEFTNQGATGPVTFTLPAIGPGFKFLFRAYVNQNLIVTSNEGSNIIYFNNASASTLAFQTSGAIIGGGLLFYSNPAGTKWEVQNISIAPQSNTITQT
jgi:hypothetical protein